MGSLFKKKVFLSFFLGIVVLSVAMPAAKQNLSEAFCSPGYPHLLGCSALGEDILQQIGAGIGETTLIALAGRLGSILLAYASLAFIYFLGTTGVLVQNRLTEAFLTIPSLLLALAFQAIMGASTWAMVAAIALSEWAVNHRWLAGRLNHYQKETYIQAARVTGADKSFMASFHLLPHISVDVRFLFFAYLPDSFLTVSALEFLGFASAGSRDGLGYLVAVNKDLLFVSPLNALAPAITLIVLILFFTKVKDLFEER